jgi:hypothetical protein
VIRLFAIENEIDRFNLARDTIKRVPKLQKIGAHAKEKFQNDRLHAATMLSGTESISPVSAAGSGLTNTLIFGSRHTAEAVSNDESKVHSFVIFRQTKT